MWLLGPTLRRSAYSIGRTRVTRPPFGRGRQERTISQTRRLSRKGRYGTSGARGAAFMWRRREFITLLGGAGTAANDAGDRVPQPAPAARAPNNATMHKPQCRPDKSAASGKTPERSDASTYTELPEN